MQQHLPYVLFNIRCSNPRYPSSDRTPSPTILIASTTGKSPVRTTRQSVKRMLLSDATDASSTTTEDSSHSGPSKKTRKSSKGEKTDSSIAIACDGDKRWYSYFTKGEPEYETYMAEEWGIEKHGESLWFEQFTMAGAQCGLSWWTVLLRRDTYRRTFHNYDVAKVAAMTEADVEHILCESAVDPRDVIVRNRRKAHSVIHNAKCILKLKSELNSSASIHGALDDFVWSFVGHKPILHRVSEWPEVSPESEALSEALKNRGFRFLGPTTCYAIMQSMGMIVDHPYDSPEYQGAKLRLEKRVGGYQDRTNAWYPARLK